MDTRRVSSRESSYSVESATSEEDEEEQRLPPPKGNFRVFLLDDGSDVRKEARLPRHRCLNGPGFLLLPGLHGQGRKRWVRKPLGPLPSARPQPPGPGCRCYLEVPGETFRGRLVSPSGSLPGQRVSQKRAESSGGYKRQSSATGGGQPLPCSKALSPHGMKRQRKKEIADEETLRSPCWTEGDQVFAQKCWELQGFVRPLSQLLDRLKMGRFDQGLSSFQQSVAMDRIQRIIGVLQKPQMGERYLGTLLQVEKMLKIWFPHIPLKDSQASCGVSARKACLAAEVDFSQMNSALGQILLGPTMNSYGVVFYLQKVTAAQAASETPAHSCPSSVPFSGSGEPPRCHSLPGALAADSSAPRGTLGGLTWSLPHLPMSGEVEGSEPSAEEPVKCRSS
ncbi:circadian-associated transcriptional repressor isoform 2-T4 [Liasis olivaceus]